VACIIGGVILTLRPFTSLGVLVLVVAINAILTGAVRLLGHRGFGGIGQVPLGAAWLVFGVLVFTWPGLSVAGLALAAGLFLIGSGLVDLAHARRGDVTQRLVLVMGGLASLIFGVLALAWPDVTVLLLAVVFGAHTVQFGVTRLVAVLKPSSKPATADAAGGPAAPSRLRSGVHLAGRAAGLVVALALVGVSLLLHRTTSAPDAFYATPAAVPAASGVLIRTAPYTHAVPDDARAWLILYSTKTASGAPAVASAVVLAPKDPPAGRRPVVAWAHGTTGIDRGCAPSLNADPFGDVPAIARGLDHGWVVVATDYAGMGTGGVTPYLIGVGEADSTLDAVRAAHQMSQVSLSEQTVIWGHSQGGHSAIWSGIEAPTYASGLDVRGVAAISPATDLAEMADAVQGKLGGSLASAYVISTYAKTYHDVGLTTYVRPGAQVQVAEAAKRCLSDPSLILTVITTLPVSQSIFAADPSTGALGEHLRANTPTRPVRMPLLVAQGTSDEVIPISITKSWVAQRCAAGQKLDFRTYPGLNHMGVLGSRSPLNEELLGWTADRFAGKPDASTC
jgi:uncharacterized membrane protein HdeD (DUF308 family)/predicted esterase